MPTPYIKQTWENSPSTATPVSATRLAYIEEAIENATRDDTSDIRTLGGVGNNTTANSAFLAAMQAAKAAIRSVPAGTGSDPLGTRVINIPAGDYRITDIRGFMGLENMTSKATGIRFVGAGSNLTHIIFDPGVDGALVFNDYWLNIAFEGMTFSTLQSGATFMESYTTNNAQQYSFTNVRWRGAWQYVFDLQGDNNNSEFSFYQCETSNLLNTGAFLYIGTTNTVDQFLNYWFFGFKHWSTSAPIIDAAKGGHFYFYGLDVSDWGTAMTVPSKLFYLRGVTHAQGVCSLQVYGLRMEIKNVNGGIIHCEWPTGIVNIKGADVTSQRLTYNYVEMFHFYLESTTGPIYHIEDCHLAGTVKITYGANEYAQANKIVFEQCSWYQQLSPTDVVVYDSTTLVAGAYTTNPPVHFVNCRATNADDPYEAVNGIAVWDAIVSWGSGMHVPMQKRMLKIQDREGMSSSGNHRFTLPLGALITGFSGTVIPGASGQGNAAAWTLRTNEVTPQVISTITSPGAVSAGFNISNQLTTPWYCDTDVKRKLSVANTTALTGKTRNGWIWVEGYW